MQIEFSQSIVSRRYLPIKANRVRKLKTINKRLLHFRVR